MNSQGFVALNPSATRMVLLFYDLPNGAMYNMLFKHFNPNLLLELFFCFFFLRIVLGSYFY